MRPDPLVSPVPFDRGSWFLPGNGRRPLRWENRTLVMGILNLTPDSLSDGGRYLDPEVALERGWRLQEDGADLLDVGGESTRPGARPVSASEEKKRVVPIIAKLSRKLRIPISVDTSKAAVAEAAIGAGARILNDVGALGLDKAMPRMAARLKVPVILMHMRGRPRTMQRKPRYRDVVGEILAFFQRRMVVAIEAGVDPRNILLDPGFGFGKTSFHNTELTRRLGEFRSLGRPIVYGPSRKATLGQLLGGVPPGERLEATLSAVTAGILFGADWVRVHDAREAVRARAFADALRYGRGLTSDGA